MGEKRDENFRAEAARDTDFLTLRRFQAAFLLLALRVEKVVFLFVLVPRDYVAGRSFEIIRQGTSASRQPRSRDTVSFRAHTKPLEERSTSLDGIIGCRHVLNGLPAAMSVTDANGKSSVSSVAATSLLSYVKDIHRLQSDEEAILKLGFEAGYRRETANWQKSDALQKYENLIRRQHLLIVKLKQQTDLRCVLSPNLSNFIPRSCNCPHGSFLFRCLRCGRVLVCFQQQGHPVTPRAQ